MCVEAGKREGKVIRPLRACLALDVGELLSRCICTVMEGKSMNLALDAYHSAKGAPKSNFSHSPRKSNNSVDVTHKATGVAKGPIGRYKDTLCGRNK